jgi:hypothetical protein
MGWRKRDEGSNPMKEFDTNTGNWNMVDQWGLYEGQSLFHIKNIQVSTGS